MSNPNTAAIVSTALEIGVAITQAIVSNVLSGKDIEPIVSALPPEAQSKVRIALEREETRQALAAIRSEILGNP